MMNSREIASRLQAFEADITTLALDAIVNAANEPLIMGGGVDGAIRRKAGPEMEAALRRIGHCPTGTAIITRSYRLPAKFVIHTVAPIWSTGVSKDIEQLLGDCYRGALELANENRIASIAFPCIGTGIYAWPQDRAAEIAFGAVCDHLNAGGKQSRIAFCCFAPGDRERYERLIASLA